MSDKHSTSSKWWRFLSLKDNLPENSTPKCVLIVDDEEPFLLSLSDGLSAYAEDFHVLTALNGKEAVDILRATTIDLVVTDLKMPEMNGFELLAYMSKNYSSVPVIVMTAFGTPTTESKLRNMGTSRYLEKPLDINVLAKSISDALVDGSSNRAGQGISIASFLQLIEAENTTCTIKINSGNEVGFIYFDNGAVMDAETGDLKGKMALLDIINWDNAEIDVKFICEIEEKNIDYSLIQMLMEGSKIRDARAKIKAIEDARAKVKVEKEVKTRIEAEEQVEKISVEEEAERKAEEEKIRAEEEAERKAEEERIRAEEEAERKAKEERIRAEEEKTMLNSNHLKPLEDISGFVGAVVYTSDGETIISSNKGNLYDLNTIGAFAAELLQTTGRITDRMDIGTPNSIVIKTDSTIFIHGNVIGSTAGLGVILERSIGNLGLAQISMKKIVEELKLELE
jgi:Response regulator containing CheY-like receiver, AAA-type ATPase, and DNA-binding domains